MFPGIVNDFLCSGEMWCQEAVPSGFLLGGRSLGVVREHTWMIDRPKVEKLAENDMESQHKIRTRCEWQLCYINVRRSLLRHVCVHT